MKRTKKLAAVTAMAALPLTACSSPAETVPPVTVTKEVPKASETAPSTPVSTPEKVACANVVDIVSPANNATVKGKEGVTFTFNVCDLKGRSVWLLERTKNDTASDYTVVGDGEPSIDTEGQGITAHDGPIGDEGISRQDVNVYLAAGTDACSDPLREAVENNGNQIASIPAACEQLGQLTLRVVN